MYSFGSVQKYVLVRACACLCVLVLYMPVGADVHAKKRRQALKDELQNANEFTNPRLPVDAPVSTFKSLPLQQTAVPSTRLRGDVMPAMCCLQ